MKNLPVYAVDAIDYLVQPDEFDDVSPESPALMILTDFKNHRPHVVEAYIPATEAAESMLQEKVYVKLVINKQNEFIGLVSYEDLSEQSILLTQVAQGVAHEDVLVSDLMHARESINAINFDDLQRCTVGDIIYTLQRHGEQYFIVVDRTQHHIRGVVASSEISRRLHSPIPVEKHLSLVDLLSAVRN